MLVQVPVREGITRGDRTALATWLAELLSRQGPGKYVLHVGVEGTVRVEQLRTPLRFDYPQRLSKDA